jgi:hypothetical protein
MTTPLVRAASRRRSTTTITKTSAAAWPSGSRGALDARHLLGSTQLSEDGVDDLLPLGAGAVRHEEQLRGRAMKRWAGGQRIRRAHPTPRCRSSRPFRRNHDSCGWMSAGRWASPLRAARRMADTLNRHGRKPQALLRFMSIGAGRIRVLHGASPNPDRSLSNSEPGSPDDGRTGPTPFQLPNPRRRHQPHCILRQVGNRTGGHGGGNRPHKISQVHLVSEARATGAKGSRPAPLISDRLSPVRP